MDWSSIGSLLEDKEQIEEILRALGLIIFGEDPSKPFASVNVFPGSYPVPLVARDLEAINNEYWVTEQPSEANYCMLLSLESGVYIVTGDLSILSINMKLPKDEGDLDANQHMTLLTCVSTLLDGVMVFNHCHQKMSFMIIDVVANAGTKCTGSLSQRFFEIRDIVKPLRKKYPPGEDVNLLPFLILGQDYVKVKHLKSFLTRIERYEDDQGARYIYHNKTRYHDSCGLTFVPDSVSWCPWENRQVKSWLWPDLDVAKFLVKFEDGMVMAFCTGSNDELVKYRPLELSPAHHEAVCEALIGNPDGITVSFSFDPEGGQWIFNRVSEGSPIFIIDLSVYLERIASTVTRQQLEANAAASQPSQGPTQTPATVHSSLRPSPPNSSYTPTSYTPTASLTPNFTTTPTSTMTPNPTTPYTPSPRPTSSTGPSPVENEEVYDSPPDRNTYANGRGRTPTARTSAPSARKRALSESTGTAPECPPKKFRL